MGIKIVLVDDDSLIRESFKIMLSYDEHIEIMKVFGDGMDAIEYCSKEKVDIALLDVRMPRINGIQATREIVKRSNTKVIILTTFDEDEYIKDRDFYESYEETVPGRICHTFDELIEGIKMCQTEPEQEIEIIDKFIKKNFTYTDGRATERVVDLIEGCLKRE